MRNFTKEAAFTYLTTTELCYGNYFISGHVYTERLYLLKEFCNQIDEDIIANIDLCIFNFLELYSFRGEYSFYHPYGEINDNFINEEKESDDTSELGFQGDDFDPNLHFIASSSGKMGKWEFHKTDSDFFPSIPHGHLISNNKIKLDSYTGHIYKNNKKHDRELRRFIVSLWNDGKFRESARETIFYYINTYPHFHWRVDNPLLLPKRRK